MRKLTLSFHDLTFSLPLFLLSLATCVFHLSGCGYQDFSPMPGSAPTSQPFVTIQAINNTTAITGEDWAHECEAVNRQLQNEFRQDWGLNVALVLTQPADFNPQSPALFTCLTLPDPSKSNNVGGYHIGRLAYVKAAPGYSWRITTSHEVLELCCHEGVNTIGDKFLNLLNLFRGKLPEEICDPVEGNGYNVDSTGKVSPTFLQDSSCSDYCTPAWFKVGSVSYTLDGKPRYDFLQITSQPGEITPRGQKPKNIPQE